MLQTVNWMRLKHYIDLCIRYGECFLMTLRKPNSGMDTKWDIEKRTVDWCEIFDGKNIKHHGRTDSEHQRCSKTFHSESWVTRRWFTLVTPKVNPRASSGHINRWITQYESCTFSDECRGDHASCLHNRTRWRSKQQSDHTRRRHPWSPQRDQL